MWALWLGTTSAVRADPDAGHFDFLYIDANVGTSSGGHVGLRIGDEVFHYQHDAEGFIVLARDTWPRFRLIYNDLDNRNIQVARVKVAAADLELIRDRFVQRHLIQNRHLDFLAALRRDSELLFKRRHHESPAVPGAGLFRHGSRANPDLLHLRAAVEARFGMEFLAQQASDLDHSIGVHAYSAPNLDATEVTDTRYPAYPPTFSETWLDQLAKLAALRVLAGGALAAEGSQLHARHYGVPDSDVRLNGALRAQLARLEQELRSSVTALLASPRSDSGFPLLLAAARYLAVRESLASGRLVLVHPYFGAAAATPFPDTREGAQALALSSLRFAASFRETRAAFARLPEIDELSLNLLENSAARYFETHRALRERRPFRLPADLAVPAAPGPVPAAGGRAASQSESPIDSADAAYQAFRDQLGRIYPYNLVARNCATELVRTLNTAFRSEADAARSLGSALDPDTVSARIPFRLFDTIAERLRVEYREALPSYRRRTLAHWGEQQHPLWIYLAESNIASSSLYRQRPGDTLFLLFTDDVFWPRPLYGAANLAFGLANAGAGLLTSPIDHGDRISEGLRGALFSLPELAFINIRKGSFPGTSLR